VRAREGALEERQERPVVHRPRARDLSLRGEGLERVLGRARSTEPLDRVPLPALVPIPAEPDARPQQRRRRVARVEPLVEGVRGKRVRHDPQWPRVVREQQRRGGRAVVRQRDRRPARRQQAHAREEPAGDGQRVVPEPAVDLARPAVLEERSVRGRRRRRPCPRRRCAAARPGRGATACAGRRAGAHRFRARPRCPTPTCSTHPTTRNGTARGTTGRTSAGGYALAPVSPTGHDTPVPPTPQ
jgi:hypothetical protein